MQLSLWEEMDADLSWSKGHATRVVSSTFPIHLLLPDLLTQEFCYGSDRRAPAPAGGQPRDGAEKSTEK